MKDWFDSQDKNIQGLLLIFIRIRHQTAFNIFWRNFLAVIYYELTGEELK